MNLRRWLRSLFLFIGLLVSVSAFSVEGEEQDKRQFDKKSLEEYKNDPEFDYSNEYAQSNSGLSLLLAYIFSKIAEFFDQPGLQWVGPSVFRVLLVAGIIIALILIFKLRYNSAFGKYSSKYYNPVVGYTEVIREDYQKLLDESFNNKEYKLAVRYLFLNTLQILENKKVIKITKWKTPYEYLKEIPEEKKKVFKEIIDLFENSWYGDHLPNDESVKNGLNHLHQLKNA